MSNKKNEKPEETPETNESAAANESAETTEMAKTKEAKKIEVWQSKYRLPSWQFAALTQLKNWKGGKSVTKAEFDEALSELKNIRIGG
jgi:hypothetical protein